MLRLLLLADTHLGFDAPARPRVDRRRQGEDFFANTERALARALEGDVDAVVHAGDLFFRSRIGADLALRGYALLRRVADAGVPVFVVPGNHERSALPFPLLGRHPRIFVFDRPRCFSLLVRGQRLALGGFPFERGGVRSVFTERVRSTGLHAAPADIRLLCLHEAVEGARVGVNDFTFRDGPDVVRARELPTETAAVLAGHIHRHQVLATEPPVFYPGSVERTSVAERNEAKGYLLIDLEPSAQGGRVASFGFVELPTRPMAVAVIRGGGLSGALLQARIASAIAAAPPDAVLRLRVDGVDPERLPPVLRAEALRALAPPSMTLTLRAVKDVPMEPGRSAAS